MKYLGCRVAKKILDIQGIKKEELQVLENNLYMFENRHNYKIRKTIRISDTDYDKFMKDFGRCVVLNYIAYKVALDYIKWIDVNNRKIVRGKEVSLQTQIDIKINEILKELSNGEDKHHRHDLQPNGEGKQTEGKKD